MPTKEKKLKKEHKHKWEYGYNDCSHCGGYEQRCCKVEDCHKLQMRKGSKWEDE